MRIRRSPACPESPACADARACQGCTLWMLAGLVCYSFQICRDGFMARSPHHLSLERCHDSSPPSLRRVRTGSVPQFHRYNEEIRLPDVHPPSLRFLRSGVPPQCSFVRSPSRMSTSSRGRDADYRSPLTRFSFGGNAWISQVPGLPLCRHAPLLDPGGPSHSCAVEWLDAAFRFDYTVGHHDLPDVGALSRGLSARCLRFAAGIAPAPRKTRYRPAR
jgi:hypothetical protein